MPPIVVNATTIEILKRSQFEPIQDASILLQILQQLLMQQQTGQQDFRRAEQALQQLEIRNGFETHIMKLIQDSKQPIQLRNLASICLKNNVTKYWRKNADYEIDEQEKASLRQPMLQIIIFEQNKMLSEQLMVAVAKLTKQEFPEIWNELFPQLTQYLQQGTEIQRQRALNLFHEIIKELVLIKIPYTMKLFIEFSQKMIKFMMDLWVYYLQSIVKAISNNDFLAIVFRSQTPTQEQTDFLFSLDSFIIACKVMRRLLVYGTKVLSAVPEINTFFDVLLQNITKLTQFREECRKQNLLHFGFVEKIEKAIEFTIKIPLWVQHQHNLDFRPFLIPFLSFSVQQIMSYTSQSKLPQQLQHSIDPRLEVFLIRNLLFLKNVLDCPKYMQPDSEKDPQKVEKLEAYQMVYKRFFNETNIASLVHKLITEYMLLTQEEWNTWNEDPELYVKIQQADYDTPKSIAEQLVIIISELDEFRNVVSHYLLTCMQQLNQEMSQQFDMQKILLREAFYSAIGWSCYYLYDKINFDQWYRNSLKQEIENPTPAQCPHFKIVRRKAVWLLGRWIEKIPQETRPEIYASILKMSKENDLVLQLTALQVLEDILSDLDFDPNPFLPFVDSFIHSIFQIVTNCKQEETKLKFVTVLTLFVEKLQEQIVQYVGNYISVFETIWNQQQQNHSALLKNAIIVASKRLVELLGEHSVHLHNFLLPILKVCTDVNHSDEAYYMEDALELWDLTIQHTQTMSQEMLLLFPNIVNNIKRDFLHLAICLKLIESYVLLGKSSFLNAYSNDLITLFGVIIGNVKDQGSLALINVLDTLLVLFPSETPVVFAKPFTNILLDTIKLRESELITSSYICLFARMLFHDPSKFLQFFSNLAQQLNEPVQGLFERFMSVWIDIADHIISSFKRKLSAVALMKLYPSWDNPFLTLKFGEMLNMWVQVLYETYDMDESRVLQMGKQLFVLNSDNTSVINEAEEEEDGLEEKNEFDRKRMQLRNDPIVYSNVHQMLQETMQRMAQTFPQQQQYSSFDHFLSSVVDPAVLQQLQKYPPTKEGSKTPSPATPSKQ